MIYLTADWHLDHWADWVQETRSEFYSVGEMNSMLMSNMLETVGRKDTLYVLGDFAFRPDTHLTYSSALSAYCNTIFIQGNHDAKKFHHKLADDFRWNKKHYYVCHYPWATWRPNTVMLHGHTHGSQAAMPWDTRLQWRYDVGVDVEWGGRKYFPVSIEQVEEKMNGC